MSDQLKQNTVVRPIVVGVDGSKESRAALKWAAKQAELTGAPLKLLTTWELPKSYVSPTAWPENEDFAADAKSELESTILEVLGPSPTSQTTSSVVEGHASLVLTAESKSASLIVVGSRGHGGFSGMLIGSVSQFVASHAHCPVVIIRG